MKTAVYPGTFDPVTYGHLDVILRASKLFDRVIVGVLHNSSKSPLFSVEERVNILKKATQDIPNVEVRSFSGLAVDFAKECQAHTIVRGLRAITDFEYELQMAQTNRVLEPEVDTTFLITSLEYAPQLHGSKRSSCFWRRHSQICSGFCGKRNPRKVCRPKFRRNAAG